mmetsp:Transcript_114209/g.333929  ORF Transcript_114209/g.333929 Transcript_114209/m.333929 type:complete len:276 (+) Transcript_114209:162-989(+)
MTLRLKHVLLQAARLLVVLPSGNHGILVRLLDPLVRLLEVPCLQGQLEGAVAGLFPDAPGVELLLVVELQEVQDKLKATPAVLFVHALLHEALQLAAQLPHPDAPPISLGIRRDAVLARAPQAVAVPERPRALHDGRPELDVGKEELLALADEGAGVHSLLLRLLVPALLAVGVAGVPEPTYRRAHDGAGRAHVARHAAGSDDSERRLGGGGRGRAIAELHESLLHEGWHPVELLQSGLCEVCALHFQQRPLGDNELPRREAPRGYHAQLWPGER